MNLFVRLFKVLLLALWKRQPLGAMEESVLRFRVWPNDLDTNLHMNNGRYMTLLDLGRLDLLLRAGAFRVGWKKKWIPVLGAASVRFRRSLKLFDVFTMKTRLIGWDSTWIYLEQSLESQGRLVTLAYLKGMFTGPDGRVPIPELLLALGMDARESPELPEGLQRWLAGEETLYREFMARHPQAAPADS